MKKTITTRSPRATAAPKAQSINLGVLQAEAEAASKRLKAAQRAFVRAADEHSQAIEANERARVALNQGVSALKASITVADLYAN